MIFKWFSAVFFSMAERKVELEINADKIVVAVSKNLESVKREAQTLLKKAKERKTKFVKICKDEQLNFAYNSAVNSLNGLLVNNRIFAGLPWFFQFWTRDEAIAVGALIKQKRYDEAKKILFKENLF